jgi:glucose dehydrogenase
MGLHRHYTSSSPTSRSTVSRAGVDASAENGFFYVIDRTNGQLISAQPFAQVNWAISHPEQSSDRSEGSPFQRSQDAVHLDA